jgi:hypothetical protein
VAASAVAAVARPAAARVGGVGVSFNGWAVDVMGVEHRCAQQRNTDKCSVRWCLQRAAPRPARPWARNIIETSSAITCHRTKRRERLSSWAHLSELREPCKALCLEVLLDTSSALWKNFIESADLPLLQQRRS